jgi:hypothetical protein
MNKKLQSILTLAVAIIFLFVLAACNWDKVKDDEDDDGDDTIPPVASTVSKTDVYDYYDATFGVGKDHVFQTLVYNDLISLISDSSTDTNRPANSVHKPDGDYAIFFGGAWDKNTAAVIKSVNAAAKAKGVKVYFFDPYLDGQLSQDIIADIVGGDGLIQTGDKEGRIGYTYNGTDFVYDDFSIKDYIYSSVSLLARINRSFISGEKLTADDNTDVVTPLLITIHREASTVSIITGRTESPFIGKDADYTLSSEDKATYENALTNLLNTNIVKNSVYDPFLAISSPTVYSGSNNTHLTKNDYFKTVSYAEVIALLEAPGERFIFFGGTWCPNTAAIYNAIHKAAEDSGYDAPIYLYDPIITAVQSRPNTRNSEAAATSSNSGTHSVLYANLIENYFTDFVSRWNNPNSASQKAFGATGAATWFSINGKNYTKMCVPNLILYNNAVDGGIVDSFESELTWNGTAGLSGKGGTGNVDSNGNPIGTTYAYTYAANVFADLFAKVGLSEAFLQLGGAFDGDVLSNAGRTVITGTVRGSSIKIFTYYNPSDYAAAVADYESLGITVVELNTFSFYVVTGGENAEKVFGAVIDQSIYGTGIFLDEGSSNAPASNTNGTSGGSTTPPPAGNGNGSTTPSTGDEEDC